MLLLIFSVFFISIHAPRAGCDCFRKRLDYRNGISIHAPRAGCDDRVAADGGCLVAFQSTHPVRGATRNNSAKSQEFPDFNPRTPCGVRLSESHCIGSQDNFNPRTPCGVRPSVTVGHFRETGISIHAPRAGCDCAAACRRRRDPDFNPRTPCGVRPAIPDGTEVAYYFNPRTPCGVRPGSRDCRAAPKNFNPRTPCGVRLDFTTFFKPYDDFNPRTPCGVRRFLNHTIIAAYHFNPRTPCGVRPPHSRLRRAVRPISIHAPRAGCDDYFGLGFKDAIEFQSTHPVRGATAAQDRAVEDDYHFNPRTPCGVRPRPRHRGQG